MNKEFYNEDFYKEQIDGSYRSAVAYAQHLSKLFIPMIMLSFGINKILFYM